ncbi:MAG TPA: glycosyl hydrolase [Casimicrobiaceae bacterium]|nr:glycosyl hydrolase [Casimicrobiaceae bacterium]
MAAIAAVVLWLVASGALLALAYRRVLLAAWREPVLRVPVLILESDDWGYGPLSQADRLDRIAELLARFRDSTGRHPLVTLGVVLAGPDTERMRVEGCRQYRRLTITDPRLAPVRDAMVRGAARGVFSLQFHGLEHFRADSVIRTAASDGSVRQWLVGAPFPATEQLPPALQSRWIDASVLPSKSLPASEAAAAAMEEARVFAAIFGMAPEVVVPSTFVWTEAVESAWAAAGVRVIVTPGVRNESRDAQGRVVASGPAFFNGQTGPHGVTYVVRDAYFEPSLGQTHEQGVAALRAKAMAARPALLEMHRLNFIGDATETQKALEELEKLLRAVTASFPSLRFMSTAELARQCRERSPLIDPRPRARLHFLIRRLAEVSRLRKLAWATGVALPVWLAYVLTRPGDRAFPEPDRVMPAAALRAEVSDPAALPDRGKHEDRTEA